MSKKVLIASVAIVVGLLVVSFTRIGGHLRVLRKDFCETINRQIPPEQEIARLKIDLDNLAREDDRHFDKVARQIVEVKNLDAQVERTKLQAEYRNSGYRFQVDEETLKSKQEQFATMKQTLEVNRKKLSELKLVRQQMMTELQRLETALAAERQAAAAENNTLYDASYQKIRKDMDRVSDRIKVLKEKRTLKGDVEGPVRAAEQRKEQEEAIDRYLDARFGDKQ